MKTLLFTLASAFLLTGAAQASGIVGNSIKASYTTTTFNCSSGACNQTYNNTASVLIYVDKYKRVFDYTSNRNGLSFVNGRPNGSTTYFVGRNELTLVNTDPKSGRKLLVIFSARGEGCDVREKFANLDLDLRVQTVVNSCMIIQGHAER